jgi:Glycosyltransferase family 87
MSRISEAPELPSRLEQVKPQTKFRTAGELIVVGICALAFALNAAGIFATLLTANYAGDRDFVTYWSSGRQLVQHANPYDASAILRLERTTGFPDSLPPLIMRNAPPSLLIVLPLGFLSVRTASLVWSLLMVVAFWLSVRLIAAMHNRTGSQLNLLAYAFAPALSCLISGQMGLFVLLGLVLFLRLHKTQPILAGAALWLCALKPHLFLPFCVVLLAWIVVSRRYRILFGAAIAFGFSTVASLVMDPLVWVHYAQMMRAARLETQFIPCMSTMLRLFINPNAVWLQGLPAVVGCVWALAYFLRHRDWDWIEHGSLLLLVSVAVAPYSWFMDQAVLLPAILHALYLNRSRTLVAILAMFSAAIEIANVRGVPLRNPLLYPWTALIWLAWYLWVRHRAGVSHHRELAGIVDGVTNVTDNA